MGASDEAVEVLRVAEQKLRALIVRAAEQADYDHLPLLADWAKHLNALLGTRALAETPRDAARDEGEPLPAQVSDGPHPRVVPARGRAAVSGTRATGGGGRGRKTRKSKTKKPDYPKFLREGEMLVKLGWSRREGKPYEHRAPRSVLQALVQALHRAGSGGERFTTERLFPLKDPADNSEIPAYQAYLTLAWLRGNRLLVQHGRQGYSLPEDLDLVRESDRLWKNLPAR